MEVQAGYSDKIHQKIDQWKLEKAYKDGIEDAYSFILQAIKETHGIGPTLEKRIMEKATEIAKTKQG